VNSFHVLSALSGLALFTVLSGASAQNDLKRRADLGMGVAPPADASGANVVVVRSNGAAARAGIQANDRLLSVNGVPATNADAFLRRYRALRGGDPATFEIARGAERLSLPVVAEPLPMEAIAGVDVRYESLLTERGHRVRVVVTRPQGMTGRLPAVVFIPWLSCSPVEHPRPGDDGWIRMLHDLARLARAVLVRVEKPGVGDSEGPPCDQTSLDDDLAAFRAAIRSTLKRGDVDPARVALFGGSIGGGLAPVLATEFPVAGVIAAGGFSRTWLEHLLDHERRKLRLQGKSPSEINNAMRGFGEFYSVYLNERLTPAEVLTRKPHLKSLWTEGTDGQYGRAARYFHGVHALDVEGAWARLKVPALVLWGEYDWMMSRGDHERATEIAAQRDPSSARFEVIAGMNHHFDVFANARDAFEEENGRYTEAPARLIARWLAENFDTRASR